MDVASGGRTAAKDDAYEIRRMIAIRQTISRLPAAALAPRMLLLLDQVAFSLTNFVLTIVIARTYSAAEFGAYGVGLASALAIQFAQRSLYIIGLSLMSERVARRRLGGIVAEHILFTGATILVLAIGAAGAVIAGIGRAGIEIAAATMVCAVVYFQADFDRAVLVKRGAYAGAFGLSVVYLLIVGVLAVLAKFAHLGFFPFMAGLGVACTLKGSWLALLRVAPRWGWAWRFLARDWRAYGWPALVQAATSAGGTHVPVIALAAVRGPIEVAGFVAMRSLTQPLALILRSLDAVDKNRFRAQSGGTTAGARRVFWRTTLIYGALGLGALAVLAIRPEAIVALVYRDRYAGFGDLLLSWGCYVALLGLMLPLQSALYLMGKQREITRWTVISALAGTGIAFALCPSLGAWGAMAATLAAAVMNVLLGGMVVRHLIIGSLDLPLPKERRTGRVTG
jgi:O-antigen/teichoic acid export membrane protein